MSENVENLTNVEDDAPEPVVAAPPVAPVVPPEPPPDPDEADAVEVNGSPLVPLTALKAARVELKAAKERASQADNLSAQLAQLQGQLAGYQQVTQQLRQPQAPAAPTKPDVDPRAVTFAQRLDLYKQDASGQAVPDTEKAAEILGIIAQVAGQQAQQQLGPLQERSNQERSANNFIWASQQKAPNGQKVNQELLTQMWQKFPAAHTADPNVAYTLVLTALGADTMRQAQQPAPPAGNPIVTEPVGGNPRSRPVMSGLEERIARERGVDANKWSELTKDFTKGRTTVLED